MLIDDDGSIWFRQSWLDTAFRCPEEARLNIVHPEMGACTDEAFIGTATHAGIEHVVRGGDVADMDDVIINEYKTNPEAQDLRFTKRSGIDECIGYSIRCGDAWVKDIMPHAPLEDATAEMKFKVPLFEHRGHLVGVKGTADLVPATGNAVWDWKTSASDYRQKDKQMWAIQPTIYGLAAAMGGFGRDDFTLPITFTYGVMIKRVNACRGQILTVERTREHADWAMYRMKQLVNLYLDFGMDQPWPMVDEKNYLCSAKWCDYYDICRGAFITKRHDLFGYSPK